MLRVTSLKMVALVSCVGCGQLQQARSAATAGEDSGSDSGEESSSTDTSSGTSEVADDTTSGGTTSTVDDPTDADTEASESSETDGTSSGGEPVSCWGADPTAWQVDEFDVSQLTGGKIGGLALSGDGLSLVYVSVGTMGRTGYIAVRDGLSDPFVGGEVIAPWATDAAGLGGFRFAGGSARLGFLLDGDLYTSERDGRDWETPVPLAFETPIDVLVSPTHFFDDALGVMLDVADGAPDGGNPTLVAYEARRDDTSSPMGPRTRIDMPGWSDDTPLLCALPSPDGQSVIFGGAFPSVWSDPEDTLASALDIWISQREGDETWGEPVEVDALSHEDLLSCPTSVTDDGCLMTIRHFELGVGTAAISLARR